MNHDLFDGYRISIMGGVVMESKDFTQQSNTVLNEIKYLRGMQDFIIDRRNSNRYRVMVKESLGHTAYCFSSPIYSTHTRRLVRTSFEEVKNGYHFKGSNGLISIHQNRCVFETKEGRIVIFLSQKPTVQGGALQPQSNVVVSPTLNGVRFVVNGNQLNVQLKSEIKEHGKKD